MRLAVPLPLTLIAIGAALALLAAANLALSLVGRESGDMRVASEGAPALAYVANTDGLGVYLRRSPAMDDLLHAVPEGTLLKLVGSEIRADGLAWRQVEDPGGFQGWVPSQYVRLAPPAG